MKEPLLHPFESKGAWRRWEYPVGFERCCDRAKNFIYLLEETDKVSGAYGLKLF
jgi:hypothetical protein